MKKILIVEDELFIAQCLKMDLQQAGYEVCGVVATGEDAVKNSFLNKPDVVLMDVRLAGNLDGIETARMILAARKTALIFMTGYVDDEISELVRDLQPLGIFPKPVNAYDLQQLLDPTAESPEKKS